jgi:hypothetical protein
MTYEQMTQLAEAKANGKCTDEYYHAVMNAIDTWVPAALGFETWTPTASGRAYLYVYNPKTREHGWLDESDIVNPEDPYFA